MLRRNKSSKDIDCDKLSGEMKDDLGNLSLNIVKGFHEQFAQNQNHHQALFLQVLTLLISVLIGFGYLYIRIGVVSDSNDVNVSIDTLYLHLVLAMGLLSVAIAMILNIALGFRRDQLVASNIRVMTGVMPKSKSDENTKEFFFPFSFNPIEKVSSHDWMPNFHGIFYSGIIGVKGIILLTVLLGSESNLSEVQDGSWPSVLTALFLSIGTFCVDVKVKNDYWKKWISYIDNRPKALRWSVELAWVYPGLRSPEPSSKPMLIHCQSLNLSPG